MANFQAKIGETVVDLATGQKFKVDGSDMDLDPAKYGRIAATATADFAPGPVNMKAQTAPMEAAMAAKLPDPPEDLIPPDIAKQGRQMAVKDANQTSRMLAKDVVAPLAQTALTVGMGGLNIPLQMAGGAGLEYGMQKAGINPESKAQVGAAAAGPVLGMLPRLGGGIARATANLTGKGQKAGEQAIAGRLGVPGEAIERARHNPSGPAYGAVRSNPQWVHTQPALDAVDAAIARETALGSQADARVLDRLNGIRRDLAVPPGEVGVTSAENLTNRAQRLSREANDAFRGTNPNTGLGTSLREAANEFKAAVPGLREADAIHTRQGAVKEIFDATRKGKKVEAIDKLLSDAKKGPRVRSAFNDDELRDVRLIASRMMGSPGADVGVMKTLADTGVRSFLADPNGLTVFRHAFGPNFERLNPERLAGMMTFIRGWEAQKNREDK